MSGTCHVASCLCPGPAERAFRHLTEAAGMAQWCLGMMECREARPGLMQGRSLFDGAEGWVRIDADPAKLAVDYWCGASPETLLPRIHARVIPGRCWATVPISASRRSSPGASGDGRRSLATPGRDHETEILLIRDQLAGASDEHGADGRAAQRSHRSSSAIASSRRATSSGGAPAAGAGRSLLRRLAQRHRVPAVALRGKEDEEVLFCGCKRSGDKPHCDGSHNSLVERYGTDDAQTPANRAIAQVERQPTARRGSTAAASCARR